MLLNRFKIKKHVFQHPLLILRVCVAVISALLFLGAFTHIFYPIPFLNIQMTPLVQRVFVDFTGTAFILLACLILITVLLGRLYCSTLCPLGLYQEFLMLFSHRPNALQKNRYYKYIIALFFWGTLLGGSVFFVRFLDPYTIAGGVFERLVPALIAITLITVLVFWKGRFFCTQICPVGTLLGLLSKHSVYRIRFRPNACVSCGLCVKKCPAGCIDISQQTVQNETCLKCLKCLSVCPKKALCYERPVKQKIPFDTNRRRFLIQLSLITTGFLFAFQSGKILAQKTAEKAKSILLPAGAGSIGRFQNKCLNCNLCVQNCPMKIIKAAGNGFPTVHLSYGKSFCDYDCHRCSEVCPAGALKKMTLAEKQRTQIGLAVIDETKCVKCGHCVRICPRQTITKEKRKVPVVHHESCIGCGACQSACPVGAIRIVPVERQKLLTKAE